MRVLAIDYDELFTNNLKYSLQQDDLIVETLTDKQDILQSVNSSKYGLILIDINMKNQNGLSLIQTIRKLNDVPIIVITTLNDEINKILSLEYGADDYMVKPINILELKARIKTIFRRMNTENVVNQKDLYFDDCKLSGLGRVLKKGNQEISLTGREFDILYTLASEPEKVFNREDLLNIIWGYDYVGDIRGIDVHIRRLRKKLQNKANYPYIFTKWGSGYYFKAESE